MEALLADEDDLWNILQSQAYGDVLDDDNGNDAPDQPEGDLVYRKEREKVRVRRRRKGR
jgi:hypothetical protein